MRIETERFTRVVLTPDGAVREPGITIVPGADADAKQVVCGRDGRLSDGTFPVFEQNGKTLFSQADCAFAPREIFTYRIEGEKARLTTRKTVDGERTFVENAAVQKTGDAWTAVLRFAIAPDEGIYGLGQHENGKFLYRNTKEYLYQNNMQIPMPVYLSTRGYAVLFDADCLMIYEERDNVITVTLDAVDQAAYYILTGESFDALVAGIRQLTGTAVLLPKWAFGYIQSRERYRTQAEILEAKAEFLRRDIPVSCLVLDWNSWEPGKWGNKHVEKSRFPDLKAMTEELHDDGITFMVSVWPNMTRGGEDNTEMLEAGALLANLSTYNAFDPKARDLYWDQCRRELWRDGVDAWWCDSSEPFTPDWEGLEKKTDEERYELSRENLTRYFDARQAAHFALLHAKGMWEHQRRENPEKRVLNLTRSGSLSSQRYGVVLWSGDIAADWDVMRKQIAEGLSMCMSGIPYWTLDIGAFFAGNRRGYWRMNHLTEGEPPWFWHGLFEDGCEDPGYRELYTRWLQFGTYLPMMRSHGTDTYREPWYFGEPGTVYYDTIVNYIKLRYRMLPYSYSLARQVEKNGYTMLRSLLFDFMEDKRARETADEFMYGPAYLVCPVTEPMEYGPDAEKLSGDTGRTVYLPAGAAWYHQLTHKKYEGGSELRIDAPVTWQPVFIRAGSVIPADTRCGKDGVFDVLEIYAGADGSFTYYLDNGVDYAYEKGRFAEIPFSYSDQKGELQIGDAAGSYPYPTEFVCRLIREEGVKETRVSYRGRAEVIPL